MYTDLMRRTPYLARARGSNLLAHILRLMEQAASGKSTAGAFGSAGRCSAGPGRARHEPVQSFRMLGLSWKLPGYQDDDTPPGGALLFPLWRDSRTGQLSVKLRYLAQTLDQMRNANSQSVAAPPASQDVSMPGCDAAEGDEGCPWETARMVMQKAIGPRFTVVEPIPAASAALTPHSPALFAGTIHCAFVDPGGHDRARSGSQREISISAIVPRVCSHHVPSVRR